jgi:hypothetical protein
MQVKFQAYQDYNFQRNEKW